MNLELLFDFFLQGGAGPVVELLRGVHLGNETLNGVSARATGAPARTNFTRPEEAVASGSSAFYEAQFIDEDGDFVPAASITAILLSIVDPASGLAIGGVSRLDIRNADRGILDDDGTLHVALGPPNAGDTATRVENERRALVIEYAYGSAGRVGRHQVNFIISALTGG